MTSRLLAFVLAPLLASCVSTEAHHFALGPPRTPTTRVPILERLPTRPYLEAGFVQALAHGATDPDTVVRALTKEAGAMGCDALARMRLDVGDGFVHAAAVCLLWAELPPVEPPATKVAP